MKGKYGHGLRQSIASGVKLFFWEKQWEGPCGWDGVCGNGTGMLMMTVPVAHEPVQAPIAAQHSLGPGEPPRLAEGGPVLTHPTVSLQELSGRSRSSLNTSCPYLQSWPRASLLLFLQNARTVLAFYSKPYLIFTELSSLMFCPDAHNHHPAHD